MNVFSRNSRRWVAILIAVAPLGLALMLMPVFAEGPPTAETAATSPEVVKWGFMAAALVTGLTGIGAAYAVAIVGGAAMGAVAEKPETAGRALVFVGLAEGIAIYGLIIAIMILGRLQ